MKTSEEVVNVSNPRSVGAFLTRLHKDKSGSLLDPKRLEETRDNIALVVASQSPDAATQKSFADVATEMLIAGLKANDKFRVKTLLHILTSDRGIDISEVIKLVT